MIRIGRYSVLGLDPASLPPVSGGHTRESPRTTPPGLIQRVWAWFRLPTYEECRRDLVAGECPNCRCDWLECRCSYGDAIFRNMTPARRTCEHKHREVTGSGCDAGRGTR